MRSPAGASDDEFDFEVFERLSAIQSPSLTNFMQATTFLGNHQFLIPANLVLIAYFLFIKKTQMVFDKDPCDRNRWCVADVSVEDDLQSPQAVDSIA